MYHRGKKHKIQDGIYTGFMLEDYLNTFVFNDLSLNRVTTKCTGEISRKVGL